MVILSFMAGFLACFITILVLNSRTVSNARRKRRKERQEHPEKKVQATKVIVFSILVTYHLAFLLGVWVVIVKDFYQLSVLLTFVGSVSVLAVAFYCWKSKAENLLKIKQALPDTPASLSDFSNMSSQ
nr:MAG TPA: Lipopolysaccharide assembly protein A domain [Caudoviricetes sp.]